SSVFMETAPGWTTAVKLAVAGVPGDAVTMFTEGIAFTVPPVGSRYAADRLKVPGSVATRLKSTPWAVLRVIWTRPAVTLERSVMRARVSGVGGGFPTVMAIGIGIPGRMLVPSDAGPSLSTRVADAAASAPAGRSEGHRS